MCQLRADRLRQRVGHRPVRERAEQAAASVHREIAGRPHRGSSHITREHRVVAGHRVERFGDELRMDRLHAWFSRREIVETAARGPIVLQ
jgi:hypothetical protein